MDIVFFKEWDYYEVLGALDSHSELNAHLGWIENDALEQIGFYINWVINAFCDLQLSLHCSAFTKIRLDPDILTTAILVEFVNKSYEDLKKQLDIKLKTTSLTLVLQFNFTGENANEFLKTRKKKDT